MDGQLDNFQISSILNKFGVKSFHGSFPCDRIPSKFNSGSYIVNFQNHTEGGDHWVCIIEGVKSIYYIDPFGIEPPETILDWIEKKNKKWFYSNRDLQALNADNCGYFCCYIIVANYLGKPIKKIIKSLGKIQNAEKTIRKFEKYCIENKLRKS
jgi:hypothetical protein